MRLARSYFAEESDPVNGLTKLALALMKWGYINPHRSINTQHSTDTPTVTYTSHYSIVSHTLFP